MSLKVKLSAHERAINHLMNAPHLGKLAAELEAETRAEMKRELATNKLNADLLSALERTVSMLRGVVAGCTEWSRRDILFDAGVTAEAMDEVSAAITKARGEGT